MNYIKEICGLLNNSAKKIGIEENLNITFSKRDDSIFQCNDAFSLAKKYGKNPLVLAEEIVSGIDENENYTFSVAKPAFINVNLTQKGMVALASYMHEDDRCGLEKHEKSQKVVLDYGGANVAKALHVGHLRSPIIGESLKRLYLLMGDEVISDVHLGDWGLQMGLTELQLYTDGVLDYYFTGKGEEPQITLELLNEAYPKASARKNTDEEFKKQADEWTLKIQQKQEPYYSIYKKIREVSVSQISKHYSELGAKFDLWYGESDADCYIEKVLNLIKDKGLSRVSDGAVVVNVAQEGENIPIPKKSEDEVQRYKNPMPPAILQKYNGGALYATTDIATIYMRNRDYAGLDRIEYIVDERQKNHFTQVFRVCKKAGISPEGQQLIHIGYGTMNGHDGKPFKTRSGDTIKLEDIINILINSASKKLAENGVEVTRDLALKIGVGAMKFGDLINTVNKDYVFDIDKFVSFEGKTGPYLQYTVCRINSILNKLEGEKEGEILLESDEEKNILKEIIKLNSAYEICYKEKSLNTLCANLYDLASAFSTFYNNHSVINEKDAKIKSGYIALLKLVRKAMLQALDVLAIEVPAKM
ncbi:MAG: arginine--tRNA ligase [Clostridia bacterium]|nr:arginine--tRNA ligase [Clostridia bacterium]MBQ8792575.1 arginine--tRNA ligase [Clostridia bacterium]